eukprot:1270927-Rhodomonas_salina.1
MENKTGEMAAKQAAEVQSLKRKAEELMKELPPVLRSKDVTGFCSVLVPVLLRPSEDIREHVDKVFGNGRSAASTASQPQFLKDLSQFKSWSEASGAIQRVLEECLDSSEDASLVGAKRKRNQPSDNPWDVAAKGLMREDAPWAGEVDTVRLVSCRKCSRVVLQSRFDAHWEECQHFNYTQVRCPPSLSRHNQTRQPTIARAGSFFLFFFLWTACRAPRSPVLTERVVRKRARKARSMVPPRQLVATPLSQPSRMRGKFMAMRERRE